MTSGGQSRDACRLEAITPLILTFDEAPNIGRTLEHLRWAKRVVVLDSYSTDDTLEICGRFANVDVVQRRFDSHSAQWNHGLAAVDTEWCLSLDADYIVPDQLVGELHGAISNAELDGYYANFTYCIRDRRLRGTLYPPRLVLFRTSKGKYVQDGHTQLLDLRGRTGELRTRILHDDRKSLRRWLTSQDAYASREVSKLAIRPWSQLSWPDRIRSIGVVAPWLAPAYYLFAKGGIRDGWAGLDYAAQRAIAELVLAIKVIEAQHLHARGEQPGAQPHEPTRQEHESAR